MAKSEVTVSKLLTVRQVAEALGLQTWRVYSLLKAGRGPRFLRLGRTLRVSEAELVRWMERAAVQKEEEE